MSTVVVMGWMLVVLVGLTQLCVAWYWRAVVSDAAARAAAASSHLDAAPGACASAFSEALPGAGTATDRDPGSASAVDVVPVACTLDGDLVRADTGFAMAPWLPLWPMLEVELTAVAVAERAPEAAE